MKILFILRTRSGIIGTNASYYLPGEVAKHHDVLVLEGPSYEAEDGLIVSQDKAENTRLVDETEITERAKLICDEIIMFKPDVVHIFYHHQAFKLADIIRQRLGRKVKLLLDIRTPLLEENWRVRLKTQIACMLSQGIFDQVTTHSLDSVKTLLPFCRLPVAKVSYGIEWDAIKPKGKEDIHETVRLVYAGAISRRRKIDLLLKNFHALLNSTLAKDKTFELHLYGSGNRLEEMKALTREMDMSDHVTFHGLISQQELYKRLNQYDIGIGFVPLDIYKNAPTLKVMEYLATGLKTIASKTSSVEGLMEEGFSLLAYDNSDHEFIAAIEKSLGETAAFKADENRLLAKQYDWSEIVEKQLLSVYQSLCRKAVMVEKS